MNSKKDQLIQDLQSEVKELKTKVAALEKAVKVSGLVPEGNHRAKILTVVEKIFETGRSTWVFKFEIEGYQSIVTYNLKTNWNAPEAHVLDGLRMMGLNVRSQLIFKERPTILQGKECWVRLEHSVFNGKKLVLVRDLWTGEEP